MCLGVLSTAALTSVAIGVQAGAPTDGSTNGAATSRQDFSMQFFAPDRRDAELAMEKTLLARVSRDNLARLHKRFAREPHVAGSAGDARVVDAIAEEFTSLGLSVEKHPFWGYLAKPVSGAVEIVAPGRMTLTVKEPPIAGDKYSEEVGPSLGWNAYSGSGEATGKVVYANHATRQDFDKLQELGVDVKGKIVIARYGGNFRGYKAKFAEEAGATGLIIYTDPHDSGYMQGLMKPEGGWSTPTQIQRGSLKTLPYSGDPLTPGKEATSDAERLDPSSVALPHIPVQPIGWGAASKILSRMRGEPVPGGANGGWQGGLPFTYRLTGGEDLRVRVKVQQERKIEKSYNILATIPGSEYPEEMVIIGSHHDAWVHGAMDPLAGTILVVEAARLFAQRVKEGWRPKRSIVFAAWGAEEYGMIGSTEWVEARQEALGLHGVAYINLDGAARGLDLGSSASATLKAVLMDAAQAVTVASAEGEPTSTTVLEDWVKRTPDKENPNEPRFGNLGGGSDHVGFYCHVGVPSAGLEGGGTQGDTYHSLYDNVYWYKQILNDNYAAAEMITRVVAVATARLADADLPPFDAPRIGEDFVRHLRGVAAVAEKRDLTMSTSALEDAARNVAEQGQAAQRAILAVIASGSLSKDRRDRLERLYVALERLWIVDRPKSDRPWYRNTFAATDPDSGYGAWMLPVLREAISKNDAVELKRAEQTYLRVLESVRQTLVAAAAIAG